MFMKLLMIATGASCGAWIRWGAALLLNPLIPALPIGTLIVNLIGGYVMGMLLPSLMTISPLSEEQRLLLVTGFLGSLTTFSTFSAEVITQLEQGDYLWASLTIGLHLFGTLGMTLLGMQTARTLLA